MSKTKTEKAISAAAPKQSSMTMAIGGLGCFFSVFFLAGAGMFYFMFLHPLFRVATARSWERIPCRILSSQVETHSDSDGDTYSIEILFGYEYRGRQYKSNHYDLSAGGSSSGYESKQKVVDELPAGKETFCYVNRADPTEAVLNRGMTSRIWIGLISLPFLLTGLGGYIFIGYRLRHPVDTSKSQWKPKTEMGEPAAMPASSFQPESFSSGPLHLKPKQSPLNKFVVTLIFAIGYNGFISLFVFAFLKEGLNRVPWFAIIIVGFFALIGVALVFSVPYQFLALFNPRLTLILSTSEIRLGRRLNVEWRFSGRTGIIQRLRIVLEGHEEASYRRGTNSYTDRNTFAKITIVDIPSSMEIPRGTAGLAIPQDTMHSFESTNNKIVWTLKVNGDIKNWPDVDEAFPLVVLPYAIEEISRGSR